MTALYFIGGDLVKVPDLAAMHAGLSADRAEIVGLLTSAFRDTDYDRLLNAALADAGMARLNELQAARWAAEESGA